MTILAVLVQGLSSLTEMTSVFGNFLLSNTELYNNWRSGSAKTSGSKNMADSDAITITTGSLRSW